jgi:CRP-like cAMP-binding protein
MGTTPSSASNTPKSNRLLAALPEENYQALLPSLEPVLLPLGMALYESGGAQGYVYFPTSSIVSLLYVLENGSSAEIAVTGCEGLVGIALFMGGETTPSRAVVQSAGHGYRLKAAVLKEKFEAGGALQYLLLRFTQALITQMTQTAVCNRHHAVDQQLCRWLLLSLDRLPANDLVMTQELIANMLGVRREGVTEAAGKLQAAGLIEYSRGKITVLDRTKLGSARLRVLLGGQEGIRPAASANPAGKRIDQRSGNGTAATSCRWLPSPPSSLPAGSFR